MADETQLEPARRSSILQHPLVRKLLIYFGILVGAFLLGFVPQWYKGREREKTLVETGRQLKIAQLNNRLASAVIDSRRGNYEPARKSASDFFTGLQSEMDPAVTPDLNQQQRDGVNPLFAQRDEIITLLARSDAASADRLSDFYVAYRKAIGDQ